VLYELRVENLLLMERAELRLAPGLNVLTGETGAGKTLLTHALDLLLGGRARRGIVRAGAAEAYAEGIFERPLALDCGELIPDGAQEIVLARRLWRDGRTRAYVCGRSATQADLRMLGNRLVAFYGQHEHRKLMLSSAQLEVLDSHCGAEQLALRQRLHGVYDRVLELEARVRKLSELAAARERELDLIAFELDEIDRAELSEQEELELTAERDRLRHLDRLRRAAATAAEAIAPDAGTGAVELMAQASRAVEPATGIDPQLGSLCERLEALRYEAEELGRELRRYILDLDPGAPGRLDAVEERLALLAALKRKHGGTIAEVLRHGDLCRRRRAELEHADVALGAARGELNSARAELERLAAEASARRREAAPQLARAVEARLRALAMPEARFEVVLQPRADGAGPRGADEVEFELASNPGVPAGPVRELASGGELSRVMLALLSAAHGAGPSRADQPVLVFDEIDAGVGGHTARAVGEHLRSLSEARQILCITHLPQIASLAERHFRIDKDTACGTTTATVSELAGDQVVSELVRMLGASDGDRAASQHARALLRAA
jgi:DNA repair protein RecN (Recombination protein N)